MDSFQASNIVFSMIRKIEPENVAKKIIGVLLLEDKGQEMIRLALGPEKYMHTLVDGIKMRLGLTPNQTDPTTPLSAPLHWDLQTHRRPPNQESLNLGEMSNQHLLNYFMNTREREMSQQRPVKACQYFAKGNCRNGNNCRFSHGLGHPTDQELGGEMFLPGSIRKLESDIYELLKSRKGGGPVSIASLPSLYHEKYGKNLQAEGYLTESQRHGKAGYNLTKLLARLKCIRIIDRPHGQHAVILAEEGLNYLRENRGERNRPGPIVNGSRQIYLTFPAESIFTEEDVSDYFSNYGIVEDVRIPWQEQRMFGFVNFASPDTVALILSLPNPHFVCGARVLVKAYREKPHASERNYQANMEFASYMNSNFNSTNWRTESYLSRQLKDQENEIIKSLSELCFGQMSLGQANLAYATIDGQQSLVNEPRFQSERLNYTINDLSNGQTRQDNPNHHGTNYIDHNSQMTSFPDSPFEYLEGSSISKVTQIPEQN